MDVFLVFPWLAYLILFALGLILGSFSTALAYRLPRQRPWLLEEIGEDPKSWNPSFLKGLTTRSRCTSCEAKLEAIDLIPLFSYLFNKGQCRKCQSKISIIYPVSEITCAVMLMLIYQALGVSFLSVLLMVLLPFMLASILIDLEFMILPDELSLLLFLFGLVYALYESAFAGFNTSPMSEFTSYVLCGVVYGLIGWVLQFGFYKITGKEGLGWGDIKLFAIAGVWLGWFVMPIYLFVSSVIGIGFGMLWRKGMKEKLFPFGPALILTLYIMLMYKDFFQNLI